MNWLSYLRLPSRLKRIICCCKKDKLKTNSNQDLVSNSDPSTIMSWNVQGLFCYTTPLKVKNIIDYIKILNFDVICLQEVFEDWVKEELILNLKDNYPYYLLGNTKKKYVFGEDSGLLILSKYIINFVDEYLIEGCVLPDSLCEKTVIYFTVGGINFSTTHLQANNYDVSNVQIKEILNRSPFESFIITGDLNHETADKVLNVKNNNDKNTWENMILDYIIPINFNERQFTIDVINMDLTDVTDHLPICLKID
tara:strand:- start:1755 stop:2513 length:759 start_codon:yes stop_codon:yes gene_type:complete